MDGLLERFSNIELDAYRVMPNHFHGIIVIVGATLVVADDMKMKSVNESRADIKPAAPLNPTVGNIVGAFKSITTNEYIKGVDNNWTRFYKRLWQRNDYEHVIRDEADLNRIRDYIRSNPANWVQDEENPKFHKP